MGKALAASFLIALEGLLAPSVHAQSALPMLGDGAEMTTSAERKLGDSIIRELYRDPDYIDDAVLHEYVDGLFQSLRAAAKARGELSPELEERFAWEVLLGKDRTVNAFALPGGYFGVHLGLIGVVSTRDELASVLAHELSHVTQRHISRLIAQQGRQTPLMLGTMILGALAASRSPDAAQALMVGGQALALRMLHYSPEPRVIERLIESATLLGLDDEAAFHLQRYRVAYPKDHARWQKKNGASGEPLMPGRAPGVVVAPS